MRAGTTGRWGTAKGAPARVQAEGGDLDARLVHLINGQERFTKGQDRWSTPDRGKAPAWGDVRVLGGDGWEEACQCETRAVVASDGAFTDDRSGPPIS